MNRLNFLRSLLLAPFAAKALFRPKREQFTTLGTPISQLKRQGTGLYIVSFDQASIGKDRNVSQTWEVQSDGSMMLIRQSVL